MAWFPQGRQVLDPLVRPGGFLEYAAADYYIQDSASLLPLAMLDIQPDDWVCDLCAAPGGKSTAIAERIGPNGFLLANEVIASRLDVLRYALARTGRANYCVSNMDPEPLATLLEGRFDKVLVDVPCSGQSLVGRQRQSESSFSMNHVEHCAARAKRILQHAIRLVRPGGRLILSTCTFSIEENESQIDEILCAFEDHVRVVPMPELRAWLSPIGQGCYRLWPHRDQCSGGFAATVEVTAPIESQPSYQTHSKAKSKKSNTRLHQAKSNRTAKSIGSANEFQNFGSLGIQIVQQGSLWLGYEPGAQRFVKEFEEFVGQGSRIGQSNHDRMEPYYGLAMLLPEYFEPNQTIELDDATAQRYMLGESIARAGLSSGTSIANSTWAVATWRSKPLGWLKAASNRWNNYLPSWARLSSFASKSTWTSDDQPPG